MPPQLALLLTTAFVIFLFRRERDEKPPVTGALWIPLLWALLIGSREPSEWLGFGGATDITEGSPMDGAIYLGLELAGLTVLAKRQISLSKVATANIAMTLFLAYAAISIVWSDFPFVALKRWVKGLTQVIMVLIVVTEPDPRQAFVWLMKRSGYVLFPFSILLIKYYPGLGRGFSGWTGEAYNTGVTAGKNQLGAICLVVGFFFVWHTIVTLRRPKGPERKRELVLCGAFLYMLWWLMSMANSATSLMALLAGTCTMLLFNVRFLDKRFIGIYLVGALVLFAGANSLFSISDAVYAALGREPTLTGRTELWDDLLALGTNPLIGAGFESFWLGPRLEALWILHPWRPNQAHSGYLEMYISLGLIGVGLMVVWLLSTFLKGNRLLLTDFEVGRLRVGFLVSVLLYNFTEASFKALHPVWLGFYLISVDYPRDETAQAMDPLPKRSKTILPSKPKP